MVTKRQKPKGWGTLTYRNSVWEARWCEGDRRPVLRFATEEDGEDFLDDRWKRLTRGHYIAPAEWTVQDLVSQYIERKTTLRKWADATVNLNRRMAKYHIYPYIGSLRILSVDPSRVQHWVDTLAQTLSVNTIKKCMAILSGAYNQAVEQKVLAESPCRHIEMPSEEREAPPIWTEEEARRVDAILEEDPFWLALYRTMLSTAMRPGELRALTWSDVDFADNRIRVRRTVTVSADGKVKVGAKTKTGKVRYVRLTPRAREALIAWQAVQVRRSLKPDTDYVFPSPAGKPLNQTHWRKYNDRLCARAGVTRITLHGMRHTLATLSMARNVHPKIVQEMLGHRRITTTLQTYSHPSTSMQQAAADMMDEELFGGKSG